VTGTAPVKVQYRQEPKIYGSAEVKFPNRDLIARNTSAAELTHAICPSAIGHQGRVMHGAHRG
jgi:hypothetical protein